MCVNANLKLHIVKPTVFDLSEKAVRRAGLDYWKILDPKIWESLDEFLVMVDPSLDELEKEKDVTFETEQQAQEKQSKTFQEQVKPAVETASQTVNQFANQTGETFQQASKNLNETWKKQDKKTQTNLIMLAVADIPFIIWALGIYLIGVASDEVGATLPLALFLLIFSLPFAIAIAWLLSR